MSASDDILVPIRTRVLLRGLVGTADSVTELSVEYCEDSADVTWTSSGTGVLDFTSITRVVISNCSSALFWTPPNGTYILTAFDGRGSVALDTGLMDCSTVGVLLMTGSIKLIGLFWCWWCLGLGRVEHSERYSNLRFFNSRAIFWCEVNNSNVSRTREVPTQRRLLRMQVPVPDVSTMWCLVCVRDLTSSQYMVMCLLVPRELPVDACGTNLSPSRPTSKLSGVVRNPSSYSSEED